MYKSPQKWSQGQNPNCSRYTVSIMCLTPTMYAIYTTCRNATKSTKNPTWRLLSTPNIGEPMGNLHMCICFCLMCTLLMLDQTCTAYLCTSYLVRWFSLGICIFVCICAFVYSLYLYLCLYLCVCLLFVFNRFSEVGDKTCTGSTTR